jgi:hypothetical protein
MKAARFASVAVLVVVALLAAGASWLSQPGTCLLSWASAGC